MNDEYTVFDRDDLLCTSLFRITDYLNIVYVAHQIDFQLYNENLIEYIKINGGKIYTQASQ